MMEGIIGRFRDGSHRDVGIKCSANMYGNVGRYCNGRLSSIFLQFTKSTCQPMLVVLVGQE